MLHRYAALLVTGIVVTAAIRGFQEARKTNRTLALWAAAIAPVLVLLQVGLGVLTVMTAIGLVEVTAHLAIGALLFADMLVLYLALGDLVPVAHEDRSSHAPTGISPEIQGVSP